MYIHTYVCVYSMYVLSVHVCHLWKYGSRKKIWVPWDCIQAVSHHGCWELNPGPLQSSSELQSQRSSPTCELSLDSPACSAPGLCPVQHPVVRFGPGLLLIIHHTRSLFSVTSTLHLAPFLSVCFV